MYKRQGTTSSRCILFDRKQNVVSSAAEEFPQYYPKPGWVEQDPSDLFVSIYSVLLSSLEKGGISPKELSGIGITNQRETTLVWDKTTGRPVYNAIGWQCRRTAQQCERLKKEGRCV